MEKISVIVPVYNVEKYIEKCLDSIINQTYKNLEIILVDDGSTDNSGKICDKYANKDNRIKVIHKKNGGLSDARNVGMDKATGKYIGFVDSDDYIEYDMYEVLYNNIKEENADMSIGGIIDCYGEIKEHQQNNVEKLILDKEQAIKLIFEGKMSGVSAVNKLYKISLFENIKYPVGKTCEDAMVIVELLMECRKIVLTTKKIYYYIHRENSITTVKFNKSNYDLIEAYEKNKKLIENNFPNLLNQANMRLCWSNFVVLDKMILGKVVLDQKIINYLKNNFFFIILSNLFTISRKISIIVLIININLYKILVKKFNKQKRKLFSK